jgi:DMSO/TMAO reductase YedYZ molybdopterin-dependent catalytic subunit
MTQLPPGQRDLGAFPRFGVPAFASRVPSPGAPIALSVGDRTLDTADLEQLPRVEVHADFHCVTTWSKCDLRWSGWRIRDVVDRFLIRRTYLEVRAADGYMACILLEDALDDDVLLSDRLDGTTLSIEHGAPLRFVAPKLYAYKSVKHVVSLETCDDYRVSYAERQTRAHPRGRVALEERGQLLPGWMYRYIYRALIRPTAWWYERAAKRSR